MPRWRLLFIWGYFLIVSGEFDSFLGQEPLSQIAVQEETGTVFLGGRNVIYKLNSSLRLSQEKRTGPAEDSIQCALPPHHCLHQGSLTNDHNKVLLIYNNNKTTMLLSCGTLYYGMCRLLPVQDIEREVWIGNGSDPIDFLGGNESVVTFFAPSVSVSQALYVAVSYDGRDEVHMTNSVSSRAFSYTDAKQFVWKYPYSSEYDVTAIDIHHKFKKSFKVTYVYGFSYQHFSYFLLTRQVGPKSEFFMTYLARVCQDDHRWISYTEVPLKCQRGGIDQFNLATAATLGPASKSLKRRLNENTEDPVLYVSFVQTLEHHEEVPNRVMGSVVCSYPMSQVISHFTNITKDCYEGGHKSSLNEFITGKAHPCTKNVEVNITDNFCGTGSNSFIESKDSLPGGLRTNVTSITTSIVVLVQNHKTIAVLGGDDGTIKKVMLERRLGHMLLDTSLSEPDSLDRRIQRSNYITPDQEFIYFLTDKKAVKFPIGSCSVYTSCKDCIRSEDPLECYWFGTYCGNHSANNSGISNDTCPPSITKISPLTGPLAGDTLITIEGQNFGRNTGGNISITVAGFNCRIIYWHLTTAKCKTQATNAPKSGPIKVSVIDETYDDGYDMKGVVESKADFSYLKPQIYTISPSYGPFSGGINITITGKHLNIGAKLNITAASKPCFVIFKSSSQIVCQTSESSRKVEGPILVTIDGMLLDFNVNFAYKPDPKITKIEPEETVMSGGTQLTVFGSYLDSVDPPMIAVLYTSTITARQNKLFQNCTVLYGGAEMKCSTPSLSSVGIVSPKNSKSYTTQVIDGLTAIKNLPIKNSDIKLYYYRDPDLISFAETKNVSLFDGVLEIEGSNLNLAENISVTIEEKECEISDIKRNYLVCLLPSDLTLYDTKTVVVHMKMKDYIIGNISVVEVASLEAKEDTNRVSVVKIVLPILFLIGAIIGIILFLRWKRRNKRSSKNELTVVYRRDLSSNGAAFESNDYHDFKKRLSSNRESGACASIEYSPFQVDAETLHLLQVEKILISRECLSFGNIIGQGHFGQVYHGRLQMPDKEFFCEVAIKTLHNSRSITEREADAFLKEGLIMKDFAHENVLALIGVSFEEDGLPMVIIPFMANGDLLSYIRNENVFPSLKLLIKFGVQISNGMNYLAGLKFVHRDLAARNCMLDENLVAKVADFGLSRDIYEKDYYSSDNKKTELPVKWMSIESLEKGTYNTKTDVWSYGVVLWELMTRGMLPYPGIGNWDILKYLKEGRRMPQPSYCPSLLYDIMARCWSLDPKLRPTFSQLCVEVESVISKLEKKSREKKIGLEVTYVNVPDVTGASQ